MNSELESFPDQVNNEAAKRGNRRDVAISPDRNEPIVKRNRPALTPLLSSETRDLDCVWL